MYIHVCCAYVHVSSDMDISLLFHMWVCVQSTLSSDLLYQASWDFLIMANCKLYSTTYVQGLRKKAYQRSEDEWLHMVRLEYNQ